VTQVRLRTIFLLGGAIAAAHCASYAADDAAKQPRVPAADQQYYSKGGSLRELIAVRVENLKALLDKKQSSGKQIMLFLNGREMTGIAGDARKQTDDSGAGVLLFTLERNSGNQDAWKPFLSQPSAEPAKLTLSVGLHGEQPIATDWDNFLLTVLHRSWFFWWLAAILILLVIFIWKARTTPLLRETGLPGAEAAYSLAQCQMAWWFFVIVAAFALLYMVTWDYNTITAGTLTLMGISAATGLAGAVVDSSKKEQMLSEQKDLEAEKPTAAEARKQQIDARLAEIRIQTSTPKHIDFLTDILTDSNGISFHRFQIVVWTLVLTVVFIISVRADLIMPDFSATLLGLMGISSGTYIGFKFPETKN
jgi:hypothetical protein